MSQDIATSSFCSVIQVDEDVSFVLDNRDIDALAIPTEKHLGMSRKTYSKKHPVSFNPPLSLLDHKVNGDSTSKSKKSSLKYSPKCTLISSEKTKDIRKKRPLDSDLFKTPVPKIMRKKEPSSTKVPVAKINGRITNRFQRSLQSNNDSDIEIIEVIQASSSRALKRYSIDAFNAKERNRERLSDIQKKKNSSILKPCYPSNDDVPITEADIAPVIPSNSFIPDTSVSETNQDVKLQNKWMLSAGMSTVSSVQNGEIRSAKESVMNYTNKFNLCESTVKVSQEKKNSGGRELKNLYANLNEIYWAKEKVFQQMISGNNDHRHSERITAKATDVGKSLRRIKAGSGNKPLYSDKQKRALAKKKSANLALNRAKFGRLKPKLMLKKGPKSKPTVNKASKKVVSKPIAKSFKKLKVTDKGKNLQTIVKQKTVTGPRQRQPTPSTSKTSTVTGKFSKNKFGGNSSKSLGKSVLPSALKKIIKTENGPLVFSKGSSTGKEMKKFEYSKEVKLFGKSFTEEISAVKKGSKLKVQLEPLQHTNLWNSDFCEAFSKYVLEQSSSQMETKSKDSIKAMFEDLMDSWYNNPPENAKLPKKKKPEEETLRSSVRQSEGAFRYKEIVVKKHENYMQFILVPNAVKQNSLSIEAMKELKDAFLLAKKDPNCRAVLLNSSGTFFCTGIDLSLLIGNNKKQVAEEMALTLKELVLTLSTFTKPVVAAVNGTAVGFGVTILTFCDVVLASDKATFCIPATRLGYLPEGAITLTLPQVVGSTVATELLLYGRRLTADQALRYGLVSEVLWHSNLMNEVVPRVQVIVSQPLQVMEATKTMVRCQLWDKLKSHMEREWRLLPPLWLDAQCQNNIKKALQTGWLID